MPNLKITSILNPAQWSSFVYDHPNGNIFQTPEMYEVYKNTKNYKPISLFIIDDNDEILGILLAVIQKEYSGVLGNFTARSIIFGGPLIKNNDANILDFILQEYNKTIRKKAIYSQFRNMWDWGDLKDIFIKNGFEYEDHLDIIVDLNKNEEELWKELNTKRRNEIRRAKKENSLFSIKNTLTDLNECYKILKSVYNRAKLPLPSFDFFVNIFKISNANLV
jgi:lipid II:glycine glycyltransferase (peptidoglycan interpeptide bridge formation enzyme)